MSTKKKIIYGIIVLLVLLAGAFLAWKKVSAPTKEQPVTESPSPSPTPNPSPTSTTATLTGHVDIGPFCPVQRADQTCPIPAGTYDKIKIIVYDLTGKNILYTLDVDSSGNYSKDLDPGTYQIDYQRTGGMYPHYPETINLVAGETHEVDFSIDTGIR